MDPKAAMFTRAKARTARTRITCTIFVLMSAMTATLLLSLAGPAEAAEPEGATRVTYADLDLGRAAGRATLRHRIRNAARELCGSDEVALDFKNMRLNERCIAEAVASAASQVDQLTAQARAPAAREMLAASGGR